MRAIRSSLAAVAASAAAAAAAPALAAETLEIRSEPVVTYYYVEPAPSYRSDLERYYYAEPATTYSYAPAYVVPAPAATTYEVVHDAPPIVVTAPRAREDDLVTRDVVDTLAADPRITNATIGVETRRNTVTLNGIVRSSQQAELAARDAQAVPGVLEVNNLLRARVGGTR